MNAIDDSSIKQVLRIALVGIRSADQVILKGYLRVILRLEADLEWVSANHPNIDLFMINNEFRHADSVMKLLASKTGTAALYIDRAADGQGYISGHTLVLPLKQVNELSQWLYRHMTSLGGNPQSVPQSTPTANTLAATPKSTANQVSSHPSAVSASAQARTLEEVPPTRAAAPSASPTASAPSPSSMAERLASNHLKTDPYASQRRAFIQLICQARERSKSQDRIWAIQNLAGHTLMYLAPKYQRMYVTPSGAKFRITSDWQLVSVAALPNYAKAHTQDLFQWLWQQALAFPELLAPVLDDLPTSTLTSWVKPYADSHRHDRLLLQAVWERQALSPAQVAHITQIDLVKVRNTWAALLAAGVFQDPVYQALATHTLATNDQLAEAFIRPTPRPAQPSQPNQLGQPNQPGVGNRTATILQQPQQAPVSPPPSATVDAELTKGSMGGFLSRLRRKLGL